MYILGLVPNKRLRCRLLGGPFASFWHLRTVLTERRDNYIFADLSISSSALTIYVGTFIYFHKKGLYLGELYIFIKGPYICLYHFLLLLLGPPVKTYSGRTFKVRTPISDAWIPSASSICKIFRMPPRYFCWGLCFSGVCLDFTKYFFWQMYKTVLSAVSETFQSACKPTHSNPRPVHHS